MFFVIFVLAGSLMHALIVVVQTMAEWPASNCNPTLTGTCLSLGQPEVLTNPFVAEKPSDVEVGNKVYVSNMELHPVVGLLSLAKSPIHIDNLRQELHGYDPDKATAIFNGFSYGFPLYYSGDRLPLESKNLRSANLLPDVVRQKIQDEVAKGRVAGPFYSRPFPSLRVSPLGLVPKGPRDLPFNISFFLSNQFLS